MRGLIALSTVMTGDLMAAVADRAAKAMLDVARAG